MMTAIVITNKRIKVDVLKNVERITQADNTIFISVMENGFPMCHAYNRDFIDEIKVY